MSGVVAHLPKGPPENVEAEAALIGAILAENDLVQSLCEILAPADFYEPLHGRIFERTAELVLRGIKVTPVTLRPHFEQDDRLLALGGMPYLARLTGNDDGLLAPQALANQIRELAVRRHRLEWLEAEKAQCADMGSPLSEISPPAELSGIGQSISCLDLAALAAVDPQPKRFIIPRLAPEGEVTLFTGAGAVGKSLLAQQLATALSAGCATLGLTLSKAPAIYVTCEDDEEQLLFRHRSICKALRIAEADIAGTLHLASLRGMLDNALTAFDQHGQLRTGPLYAKVARLLRKTGAKLVCLDNVAHLFTGNENDRGEVTAFINLLNRLAGETGAAILLLGHPNKGGDTYSGSTAWLNAVRSQVVMARPDGERADGDFRTVTIGKPNYSRAGEALRFRWHDWAFVLDEDLPEDQRAELDEVIRANSENAAFLRCLAVCENQRRAVSHIPGSNYAPKTFAGMPEGKGFNRAAFEAAMERLIHLGQIELDAKLWRDVHRHWKQGIRVAGNCGDPLAATPCGDLR